MPPKSKPRKVLETISIQEVEHVSTRSVYGDNHAANEDAMMVEHAKSIRAAGLIGEEMETQLSQPWHRTGELKRHYTKEYLEMHPEHTGSNAIEMPTYETALKKQRERDRAQEKWLADWRAGKIDDDGNPVEGEGSSTGSNLSCKPSSDADSTDSHQEAPRDASHQGDNSSAASASSSASQDSTADHVSIPIKAAPLNASSWTEASSDDGLPPATHRKVTFARTPTSPTSSRSSLSDFPSSPPAPLPQTRSGNSTTKTPTKAKPVIKASKTSKASSTTTKPAPKPRVRKRTNQEATIQPLPNQPDYAEFDYYALAALCRDRSLPGKGTAGTLRNRLIQDDINVAQGLEREKRTHNSKRQGYKHEAPKVEPGRGNASVNASANGGSSDDGRVGKKVQGASSPTVGQNDGKKTRMEDGDSDGGKTWMTTSSGSGSASESGEKPGDKRKRSIEDVGGEDGAYGEIKKIKTAV
ncbi:hypothetical protein FB567DRAFT_545468 [Paraphoma chrysanthemicola]|uniref:Uncharacterized protein n=1 Tax=Paraphoma chrysanthemicola TaxID=798071 RepID=A0A8K0RGF8_9PLEO|nr:hypothetical protein FB567DRAFT_545468 [Paraphoma chrysanthemicola]